MGEKQEIIRCKDCSFYEAYFFSPERNPCKGFCSIWERNNVSESEFCSRAKGQTIKSLSLEN